MQWIHVALVSHAAAAITTAILLVLALRKKEKTAADRAFVGMLAMFIAWIAGNSASQIMAAWVAPSDLLGGVESVFVLLLALSVYVFCELFPQGTHDAATFRRIAIAAGISACFAPFTFTEFFIHHRRVVDTMIQWDPGPLFPVFGLWTILLVLGGYARVVLKYLRLKDAGVRLHIRIFLTAGVINLAVGIAASYVLPLLGWTKFFFLGPDASMASMAIFTYAILYHRMFDIRGFALHLFVRGALFVAVLGMGWAAYQLPARWLGEHSSGRVLIVFLALLAFGRFAQPRLERRLLPARQRVEEIVLQLFRNRSFGSAVGVEPLMDDVLAALHRAIPSERAFIVSLDRRNRLRCRSRGPASPTLLGLRPVVMASWQKKVEAREELLWSFDRILVLDEAASWRSELQLPREHSRLQRLFVRTLEGFRAEGHRLFLPLIYRNEFCGFIALGEKLDGAPYFSADLEILNALRLYLALTLRNHAYWEELQQLKQRAEEDVAKLTEFITSQEVVRRKVHGSELIYRSAAMQQVLQTVQQAAPGNRPVLITGETGTGKELMAHLIAELGQRSDRPFVAVNCAAVPATLWEDEIFGHVKGAFTDARAGRPGRVAEAADGILFLDEIGEMPLDMQGKLLRLLQENEYTPIGGTTPSKAHCRFIFATNRNLSELIKSGQFRADLYYRISVYTLHLPPLRERKEDIPAIVEYLVERFGPELKSPARTVHPTALQVLLEHAWPGNIRELENVIIRALSRISEETVIRPEDLPLARVRPSPGEAVVSPEPPSPEWPSEGALNFDDAVREFSRRLIEQALARTGGNKTRAADLLGIGRSKLRYKLRELNLEAESSKAS